MNATFTIESVHGLKQTVVVGPAASEATAKQEDHQADEQKREPSREEDRAKPR